MDEHNHPPNNSNNNIRNDASFDIQPMIKEIEDVVKYNMTIILDNYIDRVNML